MRNLTWPALMAVTIGTLSLGACATTDAEREAAREVAQDTSHRIGTVLGLAGPEAVRYDSAQDRYFIANFNGEPAGDGNGFITLADADGVIEELRFMQGTAEAPLHGPRGMFITGDTLWAADADGVHGFNRLTGAQVAFVDFTAFEPGFLNDLTQGPDGALYITDTGRSRIYRLAGREATIALEDDDLARPNGITWDASNDRFLLASWAEAATVHAWRPGGAIEDVGVPGDGGNDGIEIYRDRIIVASQTDSSLHVVENNTSLPFLLVPGRPADIGIDTRRGRVAVPYIALDRVDIWDLPADPHR